MTRTRKNPRQEASRQPELQHRSAPIAARADAVAAEAWLRRAHTHKPDNWTRRQRPRNVAPFGANLRPADHQRPAEARPGDSGSDRQGAHRQEGRAHHLAHRAAGPLPGLHAHRHAHWRQPQDRVRRRAPAPEADSGHERGEASGGFIVRTAAEGASEEELRADLRFLLHLWDEIKQRSDELQVARR